MVLPCDLSAARLARTWVSGLLNPLSLTEATFQDILLAVSELVTNAVVHADSAPTVSLTVDPDEICIQVQDSSELPPAIRERNDQRGGWGLRLVEQVADQWGTTYMPNGDKVVWFTVSAASRS